MDFLEKMFSLKDKDILITGGGVISNTIALAS